MIKSFIGSLLLITMLVSQGVATEISSLSVDELNKRIAEIEANVSKTKEQMKNMKDVGYLADLYFILAEFLVDKSRLLYQKKIAQNPEVPIDDLDFTLEKRPKQEAIGIYDSFLDRFPTDERRDRALFFKAHELRELGRAEDMIKVYQKITKEFKNSQYWTESQLAVGDYYLEQEKKFELAQEYYLLVTERQPNEFTPLAHYKLGWAYINQDKFLKSYKNFEAAILVTNKLISQGVGLSSDIRKESLAAMVWPYSEIPAEKIDAIHSPSITPVQHFRSLSFGYQSYLNLLKRLAKRMKLKKRFVESVEVIDEYLRISPELESKLNQLSEMYQIMRVNLKDVKRKSLDLRINSILSDLRADSSINKKQKAKYRRSVEKLLRDVAIQAHRASVKRQEFVGLALGSYEVYLEFFGGYRSADAIRYNSAVINFTSGKTFEAAKKYEYLARKKKVRLKKSKKFLLKASLEAYISSLAKPELTMVEKEQSRSALRNLGRVFIKRYPKDKASADIHFNIAQSYFNERLFDLSSSEFKSFIKRYPRDTKVSLAINQILDAHNQRENFEAIIKDGKWFLTLSGAGNISLRDNIKEIVSQAQILLLRKKSGDFQEGSYAKNMLKMASKFKGTDLGDKALYEAFILYRSQRSDEMYTPGSILLKSHSKSKYSKQVAGDMVRAALTTLDFSRAAKYLEYYGKNYPKDKESTLFSRQAASIRELIGDYKAAARIYKRLGDTNKVAEMLYLAKSWKELYDLTKKMKSGHARYYEAKSLYEQGRKRSSLNVLGKAQREIRSTGSPSVIAKAQFLEAKLKLESFRSIQFNKKISDQKTIERKTRGLEILTNSFKSVLNVGDAEMALAALAGLGETYREFGDFIKAASIPGALSKEQKQQVLQALLAQAQQYYVQGDEYFKQCKQTARKESFYSKYLLFCRDKSSATELPGANAGFKETKSVAISRLQKSLFDKPRDIEIYTQLVKEFIDQGAIGDALATSNRALELFPDNENAYIMYVISQLHSGNFKAAGETLKQASSISAYSSEVKLIQNRLDSYFHLAKPTPSSGSDSSWYRYLPRWLK